MLRKASELTLGITDHANVYKETLAFIAKPEKIIIETLNSRIFDAVLAQLTRDGRGNEDSDGVMAQLGVAMVGVDSPDYFHYINVCADRANEKGEPLFDPENREIMALSAHMFFHEREFNCGDFRPDQDAIHGMSFLTGGIRIQHWIVELQGNPGHQRYCTNL